MGYNSLVYTVPDALAGKTFRQIQGDRSMDVAGVGMAKYDQKQLNGLGLDDQLKAGQKITYTTDDPGYLGSGLYMTLNGLFGSGKTPEQDLTDTQKSEMDKRFAQNRADLSAFNDKYSAAVPNIINATSDKYHLGDLLGLTNALNTRISELQGNTMGEGAGGYANAGQVDKAINTNYLPRFQTAVSNLGTATNLAQNEAGMLLKPYETEGQMLSDQIARESTGYSLEQQRELDALVAKMQSNTQLSVAEMQRATALAEMENSYKIAKLQSDTQTNIANNKQTTSSPADRYISMGGKYLYDTQTGKFISAPSTGGGNSYNPAGI